MSHSPYSQLQSEGLMVTMPSAVVKASVGIQFNRMLSWIAGGHIRICDIVEEKIALSETKVSGKSPGEIELS